MAEWRVYIQTLHLLLTLELLSKTHIQCKLADETFAYYRRYCLSNLKSAAAIMKSATAIKINFAAALPQSHIVL